MGFPIGLTGSDSYLARTNRISGNMGVAQKPLEVAKNCHMGCPVGNSGPYCRCGPGIYLYYTTTASSCQYPFCKQIVNSILNPC